MDFRDTIISALQQRGKTLHYFIQNWPSTIVPPIEVIRWLEIKRERCAEKGELENCLERGRNFLFADCVPITSHSLFSCRAISVCRSSQRELIHTLLSNVGANKRGGDPHNLTN